MQPARRTARLWRVPCMRRCTLPCAGGRHASVRAGARDVVIVGGGAAGLTAAYFAATAGAKVTVLERTREAGKKVLMSGGTRCNVLPSEVDLQADFFTDSPTSAMRAIFASWGVWDCWAWLSDPEHVGLQLELEETSHKWFPASNSSKDVRDRLVAACERVGVSMQYNTSMKALVPPHKAGPDGAPGDSWRIELDGGERRNADSVVLATGGLSFPAVGTDGTGHNVVETLGHSLNETYPALTPLIGPHPSGSPIPGVSLDVHAEVHTGKRRRRAAPRTGFLFTHRGFSGPAVLDLSHHAVKGLAATPPDAPKLTVNWTHEDADTWDLRLSGTHAASSRVAGVLKQHMPARLAAVLCTEAGVPEAANCANLSKVQRRQLLEALTRFQLPYTEHAGYKKAEVTGGGVPLNEMDCKTMQSHAQPGLYLCGEICDVFGRIGGFNFYWAWVSGRAAGLGAAGTDWTQSEV